MEHQRQGLLKGLLAAVTFGLSAPLISTLTATGSPLALAGLLYGGSALALLTAKAVRGQRTQESSVKRQDLGMLALLTIVQLRRIGMRVDDGLVVAEGEATEKK